MNPELTWSARPIRSSTATGTPNIDFMGVYDFDRILLAIEGLAHADAAALDPLVKLSFDGVNWDDDPLNYIHGNFTSSPAAPNGGFDLNTGLTSGVVFNGRMKIDHWRDARTTWVSWRGGRSGAGGGLRWFDGYNKQAKPVVGIRITNSTSKNWTVNNGVYLRQRQSS